MQNLNAFKIWPDRAGVLDNLTDGELASAFLDTIDTVQFVNYTNVTATDLSNINFYIINLKHRALSPDEADHLMRLLMKYRNFSPDAKKFTETWLEFCKSWYGGVYTPPIP